MKRMERGADYYKTMRSLLLLLLLTLTTCTLAAATDENDSLWYPVPEIEVIGPTVFPKPNHLIGRNAVVVLKPAFGQHRKEVDAVFAYAEGYALPYYLQFLTSLRSTGFTGDVVLCIAQEGIVKQDVVDYLKQQEHVVVYYANLSCYEPDQVTPSERRINKGSLDIFQMCKLDHAYGVPGNNGEVVSVPDARIGRTVATLRYELYWIWSLQYSTKSWIMLIDFRDSYFQTNPFANVPRDEERLWFFGENAQATRLGQSRKNRNWLLNAYGSTVLEHLADKPTICSGSTMGNQVALETYLRAMVNEWDETGLKMTGADQGFHNYLYYSHKLGNAVDSLELQEQGKGVINNVGAMRTKPLSEWGGMYNETSHLVYNWDGTLSPVVHQYDRDKHLFYYIVKNKFRQLEREWKQEQKESEIVKKEE